MRANFLGAPVAINSQKLGHALELRKLAGVYNQRLWVYRFPLALAWWARGSTVVNAHYFIARWGAKSGCRFRFSI